MAKINTPKKRRRSAWLLLSIMLFEILMPTFSYALTSGPSAPEVQSFTPIDHSQMVDLFSGDFSYNIPLFELPGPNGGYPFNLAYSSSGVTMDTEASWVGLGWSLNPGAINRQMRGLPDDFKEDEVIKEVDIDKNWTLGLGMQGDLEILGSPIFEHTGKGKNGDPDTSKVKIGLSLNYNNHKGIGYTLDTKLPFKKASIFGLSAGIDLGLSLDSKEGLGLNPAISLGSTIKNSYHQLELGYGYSSKRGLKDRTLGYTTPKGIKKESTFSYVDPTFVPSTSLPISSTGLSFKIKTGLGLFGVFKDLLLNGWYQEQKVFEDNKEKRYKAVGYIYADSSKTKNEHMMDMNREKDGMLRKSSPNIGIPHFTADSYTIQGQGVGGMFRAYRNDIGILHDAYMKTKSGSGALGMDVSVGGHFAGDFSINFTRNESGKWEDLNFFKGRYGFKDGELGTLYEPYYFKMVGESVAEPLTDFQDIAGSDPLRVRVREQDKAEGESRTYFENNSRGIVSPKNKNEIRKPRGQTILSLTNATLMDPYTNQVALKEFAQLSGEGNDVHTYSTTANNPRGNKGHHIGAFQVLTNNGMRYNYGLPVYNRNQVEAQFSMAYDANENFEPIKQNITAYADTTVTPRTLKYKQKNTQKYLYKTSLPAYTTAHLITNVLGHDYVDKDNNGPSDADYGYWVKFGYKQMEDYKWRAPFVGVNNLPGHFSKQKVNDDKGAYMYGERENYILDSVVTKTHKALFYTSKRKDARGAKQELQVITENDDRKFGAYSYKLDSIKLFSKAQSALPIKVVHFRYNYSLCPGVHNNDGTSAKENDEDGQDINERAGKLTLKKVWFTYQNNCRGQLSPYQFDYSNNNPSYHTHQSDRWGVARDLYNDNRDLFFPYTEQFDYNSQATRRETANTNASAWLMQNIQLPSSGKITVTYEADDYAKVQDRAATQMFKIRGLRSHLLNGTIKPNRINGNSDQDRIVYFDLETPLDNTTTKAEFKELYLRDLNRENSPDKRQQIYYKILIALGTNGSNQEFVSGYASIKDWGLAESASSPANKYDLGYIVLDKTKIGGKEQDYHPFFLAAAQKRRIDLPDLPLFGNESQFEGKKINALRSIQNSAQGIYGFFKGYYGKAWNKYWGRKLSLDYSWIKLSTPDFVKTGGGSRVTEVRMDDQWQMATNSVEEAAQYGQRYNYHEKDKDDNIIRSYGVAINEPGVGGDESPLNGVKHFPEVIALDSDNNLFFEYPINNAHYPGASIGYEKVCVETLAAAEGNSNTGYSIHEFFTANDFPLFSGETDPIITNTKPSKIPIPTLGTIELNRLTATQGYSIQLNDMHGKQRKVSHYANLKNCKKEEHPISWTRYNYNHQKKTIYDPLRQDFKEIKVVDEIVEVITDNVDPLDASKAKTQKMRMGIDYDFFTDMRENKNEAWIGGLNLNADLMFLGIPLPSVWGNASYSSTVARVAATNKIIRRSGIITSVEAFDQGSYIETENLFFDQYTGQPLLTKVNNHFDDPVFNYSTPAYWSYDGMGPAYQNLKLNFNARIVPYKVNHLYQLQDHGLSETVIETLVPGDEFLVDLGGLKTKAYLKNKCANTDLIIYGSGINNKTTGNFLLTRSGRRNHLSTSNASYTSLKNPTIDRGFARCSGFQYIKQPCNPESLDSINIAFTLYQIDTVLNTSAVSFTDKLNPNELDIGVCDSEFCSEDTEFHLNDYACGERGIWRQHQTFAYLDNRQQTYPELNTRKDGILDSSTMFDFTDPNLFVKCNTKWKLTNEITKYDPNSFVLEERDILNNYSAAQYGYRNSLPTAVGYNMKNEELFTMDFEEDDPNFPYNNNIASVPTTAHTGVRSFFVGMNNPLTLHLTSEAIKLEPGKDYVLSTWVNFARGDLFSTYYQDNDNGLQVKLEFVRSGSNSTSIIMKPSGKKIDNAQKIEESFNVPSNTQSIKITFQAFDRYPFIQTTYFDDLRIFPAEGNIQTYVYDPATYRLSAVLDNNNYATKYKYNAAGDLYSVHKETIEGIKTLQAIDYHAPETNK